MASIFISYRRVDSEGYARSIYEKLTRRFGDDAVFLDVENIGLGEKFAEVLDASVAGSAVLLVLIGVDWLTVAYPDGGRRLDNPDDFVRREVADGLINEDVLVIPVLVGGAPLPAAEDLPPDLTDLVEREAHGVRNEQFEYDIQQLIRGIETRVRPDRRALIATLASVLGALVIGGSVWAFAANRPDPLLPNVVGLAFDATGAPLENATVRIVSPDGNELAAPAFPTDSDGGWFVTTDRPLDGRHDSVEIRPEGCTGVTRLPLSSDHRLSGEAAASAASTRSLPPDSTVVFRHTADCSAES